MRCSLCRVDGCRLASSSRHPNPEHPREQLTSEEQQPREDELHNALQLQHDRDPLAERHIHRRLRPHIHVSPGLDRHLDDVHG